MENNDLNKISALHFGARYTGFRDDVRFIEQTTDFDGGLIVWPGGSLAERSTERYGLEYQELWNEAIYSRQPGLKEIIEIAVSSGKDLSIVLPTARYHNESSELPDHIWGLFENLLLDIGEENLPNNLILEIGNEYYANFPGISEEDKAENYAKVLNIYGETLSDIDEAFFGLPVNIKISYQAGRDVETNNVILESLGDNSLSLVDLISHQRFPTRIEASNSKVEELAMILEDWREVASNDNIGVFLSSYNVASLTRDESFEFYSEKFHVDEPASDEELQNRTNLKFEEFYQGQLEARGVGLKHAELLLSTIWNYTSIDIYAASVYGWDMHHAGRSSLNDVGGNPHLFAAGNIQDMMSESLIGTRSIEISSTEQEVTASSNSNLITSVFGFENEDKLILFVGNTSGAKNEEISIDLKELGLDAVWAWGERLTTRLDPDWHNKFNIKETPDVDQTSESLSFADGVREPFNLDFTNGILNYSVPKDQIVRVSIAKTPEGIEDISNWQKGVGTEVSASVEDLYLDEGMKLSEDSSVEVLSDEYEKFNILDSLDLGTSFYLSIALLLLGIPVI